MKMHTYAQRTIQSALLLVLGILVTGLRPLHAQEAPTHHMEPKQTVSVTGEGIVSVPPDMATLRFGIVTIADSPEEARSRNADSSASAMNAVRELGIADEDIQLEVLRLQPHQEWVDDERRYQEDGYEAVRQIVVDVHDLELLPTLVADVVQAGANRLENVTYDLDDRDEARNEALQEAVVEAREKAELLVGALGRELGPIQRLNEQSYDFPRPMYRAEMMASYAKDAAAAEPDAYAPGQIEVRVTVQAVFEIQ